mmetsp:Transcript_47222/g.148299  ORF Transcript_47222/g.148299 Transcript_47222/m.148299 type:complete len:392 (+) Transcript_47222:111-1286(+)
MAAMFWEVVGGGDKGGILVRDGQALSSAAEKERLATGAVIEELELSGERLHYSLLRGSGPNEGWVSLKVNGRDLVRPAAEAEEDMGGPGEPGPVEVDDDLRWQFEEAAAARQKEGALPRYLMKYKPMGYPLAKPKLRVVCFHCELSCEVIFTGAVGNPFVAWSNETKAVEVCAFDYPGRNRLLQAAKHSSIETLVPELMSVFFEKLEDGIPYIVWGHSVGAWVAFEFLLLARKIGLPMPKASFLMAFPAPHLRVGQRPWRRSRRLNEEQLKEEVLNWDKSHFLGPGQVVFDGPSWKEVWEPLARAEFQLFDEYKFRHSGAPKFEFPIHSWHFDGEHYVKPEMVELWKDWTSNTFGFEVLGGMGHLTCFYRPELKRQYFQKVTELIKGYANL